MALPWLIASPTVEVESEPVQKTTPEPEPESQEAEPTDEKEEPPVVLTREYCSACITPTGELKCPRRHRCKTCKCYLDDEEWFALFKK